MQNSRTSNAPEPKNKSFLFHRKIHAPTATFSDEIKKINNTVLKLEDLEAGEAWEIIKF